MGSVILLHIRDRKYVTADERFTYFVDANMTWRDDGCGGAEPVAFRILSVRGDDGGDYGRGINTGDDERLREQCAEDDDIHRQVNAELARLQRRAA